MYNCNNLKIRQKNYRRFYYCKYKHNEITLTECKSCLNRILVTKRHIKKVSNKRKFVKDETYKKVFDRDKGCRLFDKTCEGRLELHHIRYRSERQDLINDIDNCIILCIKHHKLVHSNKRLYQPQLLEQVNSGKRIILKENLEDE